MLHQLTEQQLEKFISQPSHAVLIHGQPGSGKEAIARQLAADILNVTVPVLAEYPYLQQIDAPAISSDAIAAVRKLEHFLSLQVPLPGPINRIVLITNADALGHEAQTALLKTIEEPPAKTLLILTAATVASLLPTIGSRLQSIAVKRPTKLNLQNHFKVAGHNEADIEQAYSITGGLPGLMTALLGNQSHPLLSATDTARAILQGTIYERLLLVDGLSKKRAEAIQILYILQQMAHARLQATTGSQFKRWQIILEASYDATEQLNHSAQPKLVLDALMLKLN